MNIANLLRAMMRVASAGATLPTSRMSSICSNRRTRPVSVTRKRRSGNSASTPKEVSEAGRCRVAHLTEGAFVGVVTRTTNGSSKP